MKAKTKIGIFLLALALFLSAGVYQAFEVQQQQTISQEREQVNGTTTIVAGEINEDVAAARASLSSSALQANSVEDLDVRQLLTGPNVIGVHYVDSNGTVTLERGRTNLLGNAAVGNDVGDQEYVTAALTSRTYVSEVVWLPDAGRYAVIISAPVLVNGTAQGVVATSRYIDAGNTLTGDDLSVYVEGTNRSTPPSGGSVAGIPDHLTSTATVETTGWEITVSKETTTLQNRMQELAVLQFGGLVAVLALVTGFAYWEYRIIVQQMDRLQDAFRALRDGDYDHELSLSGSDEWDRIGEDFDHLTTELKRRELEIRQREERLTVLNRALRHNLRNDMSVLMGIFEQIRTRTDSEEVAEIAARGNEEAQSVSQLGEKAREIESVLTSAQEGVKTHELADAVCTVVDDARERYPEVSIETDVPDSAQVRAVPRLFPGLVEVVENACEHNDNPDPRLMISITPGDPDTETTTLTVQDNGPGISRYEQEVVGTTNESQLEHGSGLGLWLVNWTVEKSDATIDIETANQDGTTVRIEFQRADDDSVEADDTPP